MVDDHYLVLGIGRDAGMTQIRRAYRRLSLRYHPDVAGEEGVEPFMRVREAFETLIRPARRAEYDQALQEAERMRSLEQQAEALLAEPIDLIRDFGTLNPGIEPIRTHILENFSNERGAKTTHLRELNVDVMLTPEQAARGGTIPMVVPVARVCAVCGGTGRAGFFVCESCRGEGTIWEGGRVDVAIPRNAPDGLVVETSLRHLGIRNLWLKTHLRVGAHA